MINETLREALESARSEIVVAIAFLGRDAESKERLANTVPGLIARLVKADAMARAALAAPQKPPAQQTVDDVPSCGQENDYRRTQPPAPDADDDLIERLRAGNHTWLESGIVVIDRAMLREAADVIESTRLQLGRTQWQPIDTAPRDEKILLWWKAAGVGIGRWEEDEEWKQRKWVHKPMKEGWRCDGDGCIPINQDDCTHWMRRPLGPNLSQSDETGKS